MLRPFFDFKPDRFFLAFFELFGTFLPLSKPQKTKQLRYMRILETILLLGDWEKTPLPLYLPLPLPKVQVQSVNDQQ